MKPDAINKQIIFGSQKAGKTYTFDEKHDETLPAEMWFQSGVQLAVKSVTGSCSL
jgi:hypothetical protein